MAEAQEREITGIDSATPESSEASFNNKNRGDKKKKKKKRGCGFFILLVLLAAGISAGLQASGGVDLRPFVFSVIPHIPFVGDKLKSLVPEPYSFTPAERRKMELDEWEAIIAETVRSLDERQKTLDRVSRDLSSREQDLDFEREELAKRLEALSNDMARGEGASASEAQAAEIRDVIGTFGQMSVRNAAAIIEKLNPNLAVAVLDGLGEDVRANILGRMDAAVAAGLTEQLTQLYRNRR